MSPPGSLRWAVKSSFLHYVQVIAHGTCVASEGAEPLADGAFGFGLESAQQRDGTWRLRFAGTVRFEAHHGFLDVTLSGLEFTTGAGGGQLSIAVPGTQDRVTIATFAAVPPVTGPEPEQVTWTGVVPYLTEAGSEVFGTVYPAGSELAPLDVRLG